MASIKKFFKTLKPTEIMCLVLIGWGVILRVYQFGKVPEGLNRDEAALGYNAFTLAHYGVDEWNRRWPLLFKSFGDYKLPGYIYSLIPLMQLPLTEDVAVRWPSLLAGFGLIAMAYFISYELTKQRELSVVAAALVALSPIEIFYSRTAFEAHLALFWLSLAIYCLLRPLSKLTLIGSAICYLLAGLTYNTPLLLMPVLIVFVVLLPRKTLKQKLIALTPLLLIGGLLFMLFMPLTTQKQNITIFADPTIRQEINTGYSKADTQWKKLGASQYATFAKLMTWHWWQSLGPGFVVFKGGGHPWHNIPGKGHQLITTYLLFWLSIGLIRRQPVSTRRKLIGLIVLCLISLLPSIVTVDSPHATRSLLYFWLLPIIAATVFGLMKSKIGIAILGLVFIESIFYAWRYFVIYPSISPLLYPKGLKTAAQQTSTQPLVAITNSKISTIDIAGDQTYIWFALYNQLSPGQLASTRDPQNIDVAGIIRISHFGPYVIYNNPTEVPSGVAVIERHENGWYGLK